MNKYLKNIENFKRLDEPLNKKHFLNLPDDTLFGNLQLKWMGIVQRFDSINELINQVDLYFDTVKNTYPDLKGANVHSYLIPRERFMTEQIIYWLKKSVDELISILYILDYNNINGVYPVKIKVDCIGALSHNPSFYADFVNKFQILLNALNDVANAYKHSVLNSEVSAHRGAEYPMVFALTLDRNDSTKTPAFHRIPLNNLVLDYRLFLEDIIDLIKNFELEE